MIKPAMSQETFRFRSCATRNGGDSQRILRKDFFFILEQDQ